MSTFTVFVNGNFKLHLFLSVLKHEQYVAHVPQCSELLERLYIRFCVFWRIHVPMYCWPLKSSDPLLLLL